MAFIQNVKIKNHLLIMYDVGGSALGSGEKRENKQIDLLSRLPAGAQDQP